MNWFVGTRFRTRAVRLETQGGSACVLRGVAYPLSRSGHGENSAQGLVVQSLSKTPRRGFSPAFAPLLPREDRHATRGAAVSWPSSCQRTRRDTQARVRPVANLLQLRGGSRRPWLWVGGYDRTAWVLTMLLARLSCVRPKASLGRGKARTTLFHAVSDHPCGGLVRLTQRLTPQAIIRQDATASSGARSSAVAELGGGLREVDVARHDEDI